MCSSHMQIQGYYITAQRRDPKEVQLLARYPEENVNISLKRRRDISTTAWS
ncbi:uncharacterized protein PHALS_03891 [Plasmopara halstedii]|uniref:Uncharacterized protein n=1 Tax=Plasmopara halstedii TaxID=4781 RepID=A0A0P1AZZ2_PLAHL|nr:uncharacterized protein PHALS_03891 [Plasmopara halstedii]CEG47244.1 hypothetical protein PHALS_03891 [Plasmopara halstedii]|eukprot:XP_024583613.1 hypothetical protein PHALS_03891 [Plasmopara halstedii]